MTIYDEWYSNHAKPHELRAILGPGWAICRNTPANRAHYQRCITHKQYREAEKMALAKRAKGESPVYILDIAGHHGQAPYLSAGCLKASVRSVVSRSAKF